MLCLISQVWWNVLSIVKMVQKKKDSRRTSKTKRHTYMFLSMSLVVPFLCNSFIMHMHSLTHFLGHACNKSLLIGLLPDSCLIRLLQRLSGHSISLFNALMIIYYSKCPSLTGSVCTLVVVSGIQFAVMASVTAVPCERAVLSVSLELVRSQVILAASHHQCRGQALLFFVQLVCLAFRSKCLQQRAPPRPMATEVRTVLPPRRRLRPGGNDEWVPIVLCSAVSL